MPAIIQALLDPRCYPHPVEAVRLIETHISWLLLTGSFAYKIKKPVRFEFVDFHTLDQRRHYCLEELRLNRRLAPEIYLDVVPIAGTPASPVVGGEGTAIEYAVRMREFSQDDLLDHRLAAGRITPQHIDALGDICARFHAQAAIAVDASPYGDPEQLLAPAVANFRTIDALIRGDAVHTRVERLRAWTLAEHARLTDTFARRKQDHRIRECHGDMHLGNIALIGERITVFDCIEFNDDFRWIDVMNEMAFAIMDLAARGRPDFGQRLLNRYLESSADYAGLAVLRFYLVYRALVRAKVSCIRACQSQADAPVREAQWRDFTQHIALAESFAQPCPAFLAITCGLSGSGKTHASQTALEHTHAVRIRSDVERKRLGGLSPFESSGSARDQGIYSAQMSDATFHRLAELARGIVAAGYSVIVDAAFIRRDRRTTFRDLAAALRVPFVVIQCSADEEVLAARIERRRIAGSDASEADLDILREQKRLAQPLDHTELEAVIAVNTAEASSMQAMVERLLALERRD